MTTVTEHGTDPLDVQTTTRLPEAVRSSFYVIVFMGLMLSFAGSGALFFLTPVCSCESTGAIPILAIFTLTIAIAAFCARKLAVQLATRRGAVIMFVFCLIGGCAAPLGFLLPVLPMWAIPLASLGVLCILFQWWSHLCSLEHRMLVLLVSSSLLAGAAIVLLLGLLGVDDHVGTILTSVLLFVSTILLCFLKDGARDALYAMDPRGSLNRVRSREMRRLGDFSYFTVGLLAAVIVELIAYLVPEQSVPGMRIPAVMFAAAAVCVCLVCFFAHYRSDFDLERVSKDYLTLTCALGFLPLPFVTGWLLYLVLTYLLCILGLQLTLIIIAIIELARFEEISPLWYVGEGVYLFGGMCLGALVAKACLIGLPLSTGVIVMCAIAILFTTFAQVLFNRFSYPEIELFQSSESAQFSDMERAGGFQGADRGEHKALDTAHDGQTSSPMGAAGVGEGGASFGRAIGSTPRFRMRIEAIEKNYGLSPRQCEILELLVKGRDTGYIIEHFHISKSTAKTHIYNIYLKCDIHSRQELIDLIESDEALIPPTEH